MAKTLVIKGTDFATNKVTTVTFRIPCTGISFSESTITITGTSAVTITYTVTPNDTTDTVTWESSNTNIVTIANAVLTPVGVGTCTITATCGEQTATATVTVSMYADPNYGFFYFNTSKSEPLYPYISTRSYSYLSAVGSTVHASEHTIYDAVAPDDPLPAIKLPGNTDRIKISTSTPSVLENTTSSKVYWLIDEPAGYAARPNTIHYVSTSDAYNIHTYSTKIFDVPNGINAIAFTTRLKNMASQEDDPNTIAANAGLTIEFLPPSA